MRANDLVPVDGLARTRGRQPAQREMTFCFDCHAHTTRANGLCLSCEVHRANGHEPTLICYETLVGAPLPRNFEGQEYVPDVTVQRPGRERSYYCHGAGPDGFDVRRLGVPPRLLMASEVSLHENDYTREQLQLGLLEAEVVV